MSEKIDLTTQSGIDAAEANLREFAESVEDCATAHMIPWGLVIGRRRQAIAQARLSLAEAAK